MNSQTVLVILVVLVTALAARRFLRSRSLKQYQPGEIDALLHSRASIVLLDVRTNGERQRGSIKGSLHIPLQALRTRLPELEPYRGREIVCYCQSGNRSVSAALLLQGKGYRVANMRGGIAEWNFVHR